MNKNLLVSFLLLVIVAALYRVFPRPVNFAPQIAMALFAGTVIKDKKWAFVLPLLSMFISDLLYEVLYRNGVQDRPGFYVGQLQNYLSFALVVIVGFFVKKITVPRVLVGALVAPTVFFLLSNFLVWAGNSGTRGLGRPPTFEGLLLCYGDALPFYGNSVLACLVFSAVLFGAYVLIRRKDPQVRLARS